MSSEFFQQCLACKSTFPIEEVRQRCECGEVLEVARNAPLLGSPDRFDSRLSSRAPIDRSGVWRFREAIWHLSDERIVCHPEGATGLYSRESISRYADCEGLQLKHEGENPTGSFKDRGMTVAVSMAKALGYEKVACASTGNTSASLAAYAATAGLKPIVFLPAGKVALGKLCQTMGYGALCLAVKGDFDVAMKLVQQAADELGIYLVNSLNPFRVEGQKSIVFELLQDRAWKAPDWLVCPAGNLGNTSAFGKALVEAHAAGWIDKVPRLVAVQASGANPFFQSFVSDFAKRVEVKAETIASAIRIGAPVSYLRAKKAIEDTNGLVIEVSDEEIILAKQVIDRAGIGCEPASACSLAGVKQLTAKGVIHRNDDVVGILTGHMLKDPDTVLSNKTNSLQEIEPDLRVVEKIVKGSS